MELFKEKSVKYTFSGHDSFQCRQSWLKKGYDFVSEKRNFNNDGAVVVLGVGKNMVSAIRYWLRAFSVVDVQDHITSFGTQLLADNGFDPFLEDDASLWLLHYHLVKTGYASTYSIVFNEFRREKIEFDRDAFLAFMKRKSEVEKGIIFNQNTLGDDFDVFRKLYLGSGQEKGNDEGVAGLLTELGLVSRVERKVDKQKTEVYIVENAERPEIPVEIFLYAILDNDHYSQSISLNSLEQEYNSPGSVFAMNRLGIIEKIKEAERRYRWLTYNDNAGVKELQLKEKPSPFSILEEYYGQN